MPRSRSSTPLPVPRLARCPNPAVDASWKEALQLWKKEALKPAAAIAVPSSPPRAASALDPQPDSSASTSSPAPPPPPPLPRRRRAWQGCSRFGAGGSLALVLRPSCRCASFMCPYLGDERGKKVAIEGLKAKTKYLRSQIGKQMKLLLMPEIRFIEHESMWRGSRRLYLMPTKQSNLTQRCKKPAFEKVLLA